MATVDEFYRWTENNTAKVKRELEDLKKQAKGIKQRIKELEEVIKKKRKELENKLRPFANPIEINREIGDTEEYKEKKELKEKLRELHNEINKRESYLWYAQHYKNKEDFIESLLLYYYDYLFYEAKDLLHTKIAKRDSSFGFYDMITILFADPERTYPGGIVGVHRVMNEVVKLYSREELKEVLSQVYDRKVMLRLNDLIEMKNQNKPDPETARKRIFEVLKGYDLSKEEKEEVANRWVNYVVENNWSENKIREVFDKLSTLMSWEHVSPETYELYWQANRELSGRLGEVLKTLKEQGEEITPDTIEILRRIHLQVYEGLGEITIEGRELTELMMYGAEWVIYLWNTLGKDATEEQYRNHLRQIIETIKEYIGDKYKYHLHKFTPQQYVAILKEKNDEASPSPRL